MSEDGIVRQRLARLLSYVDHDPGNLNLLAETCTAAFDAGDNETALDLLSRFEVLAPLPPALRNLSGLLALRQNRFADALDIFAPLHAAAPADPGLRFNLAWARAMTGDDAGAADLLDNVTTEAIPAAASLRVQSLHRMGDLERALQDGLRLLEHMPEDTDLLGAVALVAIDARMPDLARQCAVSAPGTADAASVIGVLTLQAGRIDEAMAAFDRGLLLRRDSPRNLLGKGLALMAAGQVTDAVTYLDQSAKLFGRHLGTWIAAGWAHFATGDRAGARDIFTHALDLDDRFAESHGALAVLDMLDGDVDSARRRTEIALRLDGRCFAGTLARTLLLEHDGDANTASRLRDITLNTPLESGQSIAEAMVMFAPGWRR